MPLWSVWPGAGRAGIPRVTLSRTQTLTSSTMQDCSGLCFCTRHQLPALMTSTSPPAWSDTVVTTSARPDDGLFLRCSPQCKDEDDNEVGDDDDDDGDVKIRAWKENDLTLESISDEETHPGLGRGPEDMRLMHRSKRRFSPSLMPTKVVDCSPCPWRCAADRSSSRGLAS
ncbi:uncharacterized protein LOC144331908 isoform X5 [Macaca mulatta]